MSKYNNYKFILTDPSNNKTAIKCIFYHSNKRFVYGTGKIIEPRFWDTKTQRPTKNILPEHKRENPGLINELSNINQRLENIIIEIERYFSHKEIVGQKIDFEELKQYLNERFKKVEVEDVSKMKVPLIRDIISNFLDDITTGKKTIEGQKYTESTIKMYKSFKANYFQFEEIEGKEYKINEIGSSYETALNEFFNEVKEYNSNSKGKFIKRLKAVLNDFLKSYNSTIYQAQKKGIETPLKTIDLHFIEKELLKIKAPTVEAVKIALTESELQSLYELDLSQFPHLERARDIFMCGCFTALRFSDYHRISREHIKKDRLVIISQKSKKKIEIPMRPEFKEILKKYNNTLPRMTSQELGRYIKQVGEMVGINDHIEVRTTTAGKDKTVIKFKYELITTHTARRTAASLMYFYGMNARDIMAITGHTKIETFEKYIITDDLEREKRITNNRFFNPHLKVV
jgi:integrase